MPTWRNWQTRTVQVRVPQGLWVRLPPSVPFSLQAGMAYRLCTSLPSWLEGFDPPYPLHLVGFPSGQRGQTVNLLARLSMVRIHLPPPFTKSKAVVKTTAFLFCKHADLSKSALHILRSAAKCFIRRSRASYFAQVQSASFFPGFSTCGLRCSRTTPLRSVVESISHHHFKVQDHCKRNGLFLCKNSVGKDYCVEFDKTAVQQYIRPEYLKN